jgi:hypothetical protein
LEMNTMLPLILAPAVSAIATAIEAQPGIPYEARTKAGITAALLSVSVVARFTLAAYQGQLTSLDLTQDIQLLAESVATALTAAGGYSLVKSDKPVL